MKSNNSCTRWRHLVAIAPCFFLPFASLPTDLEFTTVASWYGPGFHGRKTASGAVFDENKMTAANKTLPFGTKLNVKNLNNGRSCVVVINDRGPYVKGRGIDLSREAARRIGISGTAPVICTSATVSKPNPMIRQDSFESVNIASNPEANQLVLRRYVAPATRSHRAISRSIKRVHKQFTYVAYSGSRRIQFDGANNTSKFVRNYGV